MKTRIRLTATNQGGALICVMITLAVLTFVTADICWKAIQRYRYTMQSTSWSEALSIAESGADIAVSAINSNNWTNWRDQSGHTPTALPTTSGTFTFTGTIAHLFPGEVCRNAAVTVVIDAPSGMSGVNGQWYRIRSAGTTGLPRVGTIGEEPTLVDTNGNKVAHAHMLRKFSFLTDATSGIVATPQVTRTIEILASPGSQLFNRAMLLQGEFNISGGSYIDSFNSGNSTYSTSGTYVPAKRETSGNVASLNSTGSVLSTGTIFGTLSYSGTTPSGATTGTNGSVTGGLITPYTTTINSVSDPTWSANNPLTIIKNTSATITGGSAANPTRVKLSELTIGGSNILTLSPSAAGVDSYIQIWVTGDFTSSGNSYILEQPNVHVTYYIDGNITVSGNSFNNQTNIAANNLIYATGKSGTTLGVTGSGNFIGALDAPAYNMTISGAASFSGAFIANTMTISGGAAVHYDQGLSSVNGGSGYSVGSWVEAFQ